MAVLAGGERVGAVRRGHGDHDRRLADPDAADAVGDRDRDRGRTSRSSSAARSRHDLLGHALVRLVVEVENRAPARLDARRADEDRDAAGTLVGDLGDDRRQVERLGAEPEGAARDGRDERHLVAVGELPLGRARTRGSRRRAGPAARRRARARPRRRPTRSTPSSSRSDQPARSRSPAKSLTRTCTTTTVDTTIAGQALESGGGAMPKPSSHVTQPSG